MMVQGRITRLGAFIINDQTKMQHRAAAEEEEESGERPLLLVFLAGLFTLFSLLCALAAAPILLFLSFARSSVLHACFEPSSDFDAATHLRRWAQRWALSVLAVALCLASLGGCFCAAFFALASFSKTTRVLVGLASIVAGALCLTRGFIYGARKVPSLATPFVAFAASCADAQYDFAAALCMLVASLSLVRLPHVALLASARSLSELRFECLAHLGFAVVGTLLPLLHADVRSCNCSFSLIRPN